MYLRRKNLGRRQSYFGALNVQVIYGAAALLGSFLVFLIALSFLAYRPLGWRLVKDATIVFLLSWLSCSLFVWLLQKSPLILSSGIIALFITVCLGVFSNKVLFIEDALVIFPVVLLWSLIYYFFELYENKLRRRFLYLSGFVLSVLCFLTLVVVLVYPGKSIEQPDQSTDNLDTYEELLLKGPYDIEVVPVEEIQTDVTEVGKPGLPGVLNGDFALFNPKSTIYLPLSNAKAPVLLILPDREISQGTDLSYLAEHLATKGYAVIVSSLPAKKRQADPQITPWREGLAILENLQDIARDLEENLDLDNVGLLSIGDSVNSAIAACYIKQEKIYPPDGLYSPFYELGIQTLIAVSPTEFAIEVPLRNLDYIALSGGNHPQANFKFDPHYNNLELNKQTLGFKSQIYLIDGNHTHFISGFPGMNFPGYLLYNKKALLGFTVQKDFLTVLVTAALEASLNNNQEYANFFRYGNLREIFPDLRIAVRAQHAGEKILFDFENGYSLKSLVNRDVTLSIENVNNWYVKKFEKNNLLLMKIDADSTLELNLPNAFSLESGLNAKSHFVISVATKGSADLKEIFVEIETARGKSHRIAISELGDFTPLPKSISSSPYKFKLLNKHVTEKVYLQTYSIPLYLFFSGTDYNPWSDLKNVKLTFSPEITGQDIEVLIDDIGFTN